MRSYGADHGQTLKKLYLPAALPFIFNALKINATLALIGAIVAEFFGKPTQGIGFSHLDGGGANGDRHGVGGNRPRGDRGNDFFTDLSRSPSARPLFGIHPIEPDSAGS